MPTNDINEIIQLTRRDSGLPLIVDIPHSGRSYPAEFHHICDERTLALMEDRFCDILYAPLLDLAHASIVANFPRSFVDANRPPTLQSAIRITDTHGSLIYQIAPTTDAACRLCYYYRPYYRVLEERIRECLEAYAKLSLKKYRPIAARNEDEKVFSGLL